MFASDSEDTMRKNLAVAIRWEAMKSVIGAAVLTLLGVGALFMLVHEVKALHRVSLSLQTLALVGVIAGSGYVWTQIVKHRTVAQLLRPIESALYRSVLADGAEIINLGKLDRRGQASVTYLVRIRTRSSGTYELSLLSAEQRDAFFAWLLQRAPHAQPCV